MIANCYHAFVGLKKNSSIEDRNDLKPGLERLDRRLLDKWYYRYVKNRFGHDVSKPFDEPYIMYYPPPEDWLSRLAYTLLWVFSLLKEILRQ